MGGLEDFYRDKPNDFHAREVADYNRRVDFIIPALQAMTAKAQHNPPASCDWVIEDGQEKVSWRLWREYENSYTINLMPDGRLVVAEGTMSGQAAPVQKVVNLRHISNVADCHSVGIGLSTMIDLARHIATVMLNFFNLPDYPVPNEFRMN